MPWGWSGMSMGEFPLEVPRMMTSASVGSVSMVTMVVAIWGSELQWVKSRLSVIMAHNMIVAFSLFLYMPHFPCYGWCTFMRVHCFPSLIIKHKFCVFRKFVEARRARLIIRSGFAGL